MAAASTGLWICHREHRGHREGLLRLRLGLHEGRETRDERGRTPDDRGQKTANDRQWTRVCRVAALPHRLRFVTCVGVTPYSLVVAVGGVRIKKELC